MPAERLPAMWGRATLAMLVSSTSMKVESITVKAIHQGLMVGRQASCMASSAWARSLIRKALRLRAQQGEGGWSPRSAEGSRSEHGNGLERGKGRLLWEDSRNGHLHGNCCDLDNYTVN